MSISNLSECLIMEVDNRFRKTKLVVLVSTFSKKEIRDLDKFLCSPYFRVNEKVYRLFLFLKKYYPNFEQAKFTSANAFKFISSTPFQDALFRSTCAALLKLIEQFIVIENMEESQKDISLLNFYERRGLSNSHTKKALSSLEKKLKKEKGSYTNIYFSWFRYNELKRIYLNQNNAISLKCIQQNLNNIDESLTTLFIVEKLKIACDIETEKQGNPNYNYSIFFIEEVLELIKNNTSWQKNPEVRMRYLNLLQLKTTNSLEKEQYITQLRNLFDIHAASLPLREVLNLYTHITTYFILKMNNITDSNSVAYKSAKLEYYEINKDWVKNILPLNANKILAVRFKNIVTLGLRVGDIAWVENFINNTNPDFLTNHREPYKTYDYANALLQFHQKKITQALNSILSIQFIDKVFNVDARRLTLKIYFELADMENFDDTLNAFRVYLANADKQGYLDKNRIEKNRNFANILNAIFYQKETIKQIKEKVMQTKTLLEQDWLLEKLNANKK